MKTNFFTSSLSWQHLCSVQAFFAQVDGPILNGVDTSEYKTIELMDKDLSTFANLLTLSGLNISLALTRAPYTVSSYQWSFSKMSIKRFVELTNPKNKAELVLFMNDHFYQKNILVMSLRMLISSVMEITPRLIFIRMIIICLWGAKVIQSDIKSKNGMIFYNRRFYRAFPFLGVT
jgi:hypothetical protein